MPGGTVKRPWSGLVILLLLAPGAHAGPVDPVFIHLHGHQEAHVVLHWDVYGAELTRLDLVRIHEAQVVIFPLDPEVRTFVDFNVSADSGAQYIISANFDGGVTVSNLYDSHCSYVDIGGSNDPVRVRPECIPDAQGVPPGLQATIKEALEDLLPP